MENIFTYLIISILVLLIIGFFSPQASLFWYRGELTKLKSTVIYGVILIILLATFGWYSEKQELDEIINTNEFPIEETFGKTNDLSNSGTEPYYPQNRESVKSEEDRNLEKLVAAVDINNEVTNDYAVKLASRFPGEYNVGQVCNIYSYVVKKWKYVNDSDKIENFRSASRSINNDLAGDCDDFAILMAAMIESIGGDARISFAYNDESGHAFTEFLAANNINDMQLLAHKINDLYDNELEIHYFVDNDGRCWLNLDWIGNPKRPGNIYFDYKQRTIYYPTIKKPYYTTELAPKEVY